MFKSISAAAIALSLIAVPAFAQTTATTPAPISAPAKPVVHTTHKVKKHVAVKHKATKHVAKKYLAKHKAAKLKTAKLKPTKTVKPKAI